MLAEEIVDALEALGQERCLWCPVGGWLTLACLRLRSLMRCYFLPNEVVLAYELLIKVLKGRQVYLMHLSCQFAPFRVLNQIEKLEISIIEYNLACLAMLFVHTEFSFV